MVESNTKASVYGAQPRSLHINWMKYDVTDENVHPNYCAAQANNHTKVSPLRQRLRASADQVLTKRQLLT